MAYAKVSDFGAAREKKRQRRIEAYLNGLSVEERKQAIYLMEETIKAIESETLSAKENKEI